MKNRLRASADDAGEDHRLAGAWGALLMALRFFLTALPPGTRGKTRLARHLLGLFPARGIVLRDRLGNAFLVPNVSDSVGLHLFSDGMYEPAALQFALRHLPAGGVFVDVGANIGTYSVPAARRVGAGGVVLAFEASPRMVRYLDTNVRLNRLQNVRIQRAAAGDLDGAVAPFFEPPESHFGMGSLGGQFHNSPTEVSVRTVDSVLEIEQLRRVDVLKVDVEGFEALVFRGAQGALTGTRAPVVLFEFCDWAEARLPGASPGEAQRVLHQYGYRVWRLSDWLHERPPLASVLTKGFEELVAFRTG